MSKRRKNQESEDQEDQENHVPETPKYNFELHWSHEDNRAPIRAARDMYYKEYTYERIFLATGVPPSVFQARRKQWIKLKSRIDTQIIQKIRKKAVSEQSKEFVEKGLQIGLLLINRLLKREEEITPKDWKLISDSIANLHRIHQLELGKPTDISVYEKMTPQEVHAYLLETQRQLASKHDMSMFAPGEDVPEEELLAEYTKSGDNSGIH